MSVTHTQCTHKHSDARETARTCSVCLKLVWVCPCLPHASSASVTSAVDSGRFLGFLRDGDDWVRVGFLLQTLDGHNITGDFFADDSDDWCSPVLCPLLCVIVFVASVVPSESLQVLNPPPSFSRNVFPYPRGEEACFFRRAQDDDGLRAVLSELSFFSCVLWSSADSTLATTLTALLDMSPYSARYWFDSEYNLRDSPPLLLLVFHLFYVKVETRILKPVLVLSVVPKGPQIELHSFILCCVLERPCLRLGT